MAWPKREIDKMEMMHLLGRIYVQTMSGFGKGHGLEKFIRDNALPSVRVKAAYVLRALVKTGLVIKHGTVGRGRFYRWNHADYGPVSIPIAEMIIHETEHQARVVAARRRELKRFKRINTV